MPIYEYRTQRPEKACNQCRDGFEIYQGIHDDPLSRCPSCGGRIKKIISWCHAAVMETPESNARVTRKLKDYENAGMWSHAAELADKHAEKTGDKDLRVRALDNYKKAGYDTDSLAKHDTLHSK